MKEAFEVKDDVVKCDLCHNVIESIVPKEKYQYKYCVSKSNDGKLEIIEKNICPDCTRNIIKQYIASCRSNEEDIDDDILSKYKIINVGFKIIDKTGDPRTIDIETPTNDKIRYYRSVNEMPSRSRWTPTSEYMPPKEDEYNVTYIDPNIGAQVTIARYVDGKFMKDGKELKNVTAWNKKQLPYDEDY